MAALRPPASPARAPRCRGDVTPGPCRRRSTGQGWGLTGSGDVTIGLLWRGAATIAPATIVPATIRARRAGPLTPVCLLYMFVLHDHIHV